MPRQSVLYALAFLILVVGAIFIGIRSVAREQAARAANPSSPRRGIRSVSGVALSTSAFFLATVAIMLNSPGLFYMSTALIATIGASRFQAWLSVKGLHFERIAPEKAQVGELVTVEMIVWSDRRIRRPLVSISDNLPSKLAVAERTASLPVAPAFDVPIRTQYKFRPLRRGRFHWSGVTVYGTDALGLVTMSRVYEVSPTDVLVVPTPMPLELDLPSASGWGSAETEAGQARGAGIEPRGVREYSSGDSIRYIHWRSSARAQRLLVKEFETGSHAAVGFVLQRTKGSEHGIGGNTTLERMCSNSAYLTDRMLRNGAQVLFPTVEEGTKPSSSPHERQQEILATLAGIEADSPELVSAEVLRASGALPYGAMLYILISTEDPALPAAVHSVVGRGQRVVVLAYDPADYIPAKKQAKMPALSDVHLEAISTMGATVVRVPYASI